MTKRQHTYHEWVSSLRMAGWVVDRVDGIKFNSGSETAKHLHAKTATCRLLKNYGYRIDTEVEHPERGEIDVVAIPAEDGQKPFAVELETSPTDDVIASKLERYHDGTPFVECYVINVGELSMDILEMESQIQFELGL